MSIKEPILYQAIGCVQGSLTTEGDRQYLKVEEAIFPVSGIDRRCKPFLAEMEQESCFLVYPKTTPDGTIRSVFIKAVAKIQPFGLSHRQFVISGCVCFLSSERTCVKIRRNQQLTSEQLQHPSNKPFTLCIDGDLTFAELGQTWRIECLLVGDRLLTIHSEKLRDARHQKHLIPKPKEMLHE
jgi:hypothetical protein